MQQWLGRPPVSPVSRAMDKSRKMVKMKMQQQKTAAKTKKQQLQVTRYKC
jgi:hypothetical protein